MQDSSTQRWKWCFNLVRACLFLFHLYSSGIALQIHNQKPRMFIRPASLVGPELPYFSFQPMNMSGALLSFSSYHLQVSRPESVFTVRGKAVLYVTLTFLGFFSSSWCWPCRLSLTCENSNAFKQFFKLYFVELFFLFFFFFRGLV